MKIAFLSTIGGGVDPYVRTTTKYLADQGHIVHVIYSKDAPPPWNNEYSDRIFLHTLKTRNKWPHYLGRLGLRSLAERLHHRHHSRTLAAYLSQLRSRHGLDLVELKESISDPTPFISLDIPYIYKMHGSAWTFFHYCEDGHYFPSEVKYQRQMLLASQAACALSNSLADFIAGACNIPRRRITVTPYSIDTELFHPVQPPLQGPPFRLMSVGRLEKRKGIHTLVRALRKVWHQEPETHLHLFGSNYDFGKKEIESKIPPDEHRGRIHFEGFVPREQLIEAYQQSHIYVSASRYETFGYTVLEAFACGRPVIATAIGSLPELVHPGHTGWLVPRDDDDALAETILAALEQPQQREAYAWAARCFAERFSTEQVLPGQVAMYEKVVSKR